MPDREKVVKAFEYLNWYFTQDDGTADKNAVKAWEVLIREFEPVRCKDCKHYEANTGRCTKGITHGYADTWTCGNAERR